MPLFEYECRGCGKQFEFLTREGQAPACPSCKGADLQKLLSTPGMVGSGGRKETEAIPACRSQGGQCGCAHNSSN